MLQIKRAFGKMMIAYFIKVTVANCGEKLNFSLSLSLFRFIHHFYTFPLRDSEDIFLYTDSHCSSKESFLLCQMYACVCGEKNYMK